MRASAVLAALASVGLAVSAAIPATDVPAEGVPIYELDSYPDLLTSTEAPSDAILAAAVYAGTANELTDGTPCRAVTLIYARGTTQSGNIGAAGDVGPLMMNNLSTIIGASNLAVQGVDYAADIFGFLAGGDAKGSQTMADLATLANTQCPSTKIVLSGYSQGGQLVHNAANLLASNQAVVNQVAAVLIYGDPDDGDPVGTIPSSKVKIICHEGDNICEGGILVLPPHTNYQIDANAGAQFIASKV
ncbi:cutinase precursor [Diaporthe amygdali]|uniref:cutinase precursor n=1 Tax=Phomopsis amygdali TaxID=1214568 RepID=UPI0022FF4162|nr:cutinase precursor [Diaporthe amygdali]KAJ0123001.1 cutinase precursor [Diaporthe amygdali]